MSLSDQVRSLLGVPLSSFGEAAVNAFATLLQVGGAALGEGAQPLDAHRIVELGWPFAVLGENVSLERIVGKAINGKFDATDWSVIHAGALLTKLGARVEFLKETGRPTADVRAWWGGATVDAEVKTVMVKDRQIELQQIMDTLSQVIGLRATPWHLLIHLGEVPAQDVQSRIVDAVLALVPDKRMGEANVWDVYAASSRRSSKA
jgi:hypothetical protein